MSAFFRRYPHHQEEEEGPNPPIAWSRDIERAQALLGSLNEDFRDVSSLVPAQYEAYALLLHPVLPESEGGTRSVGRLNEATASAVIEVLQRATGTPLDCRFCIWDGYGGLTGGWVGFGSSKPLPGIVPKEVRAWPRVSGPLQSRFYIYDGPVGDATLLTKYLLTHTTPDYWWPRDEAWFVTTDKESSMTCIGGSAALVAELERTKGLEVTRVEIGDPAFVDPSEPGL